MCGFTIHFLVSSNDAIEITKHQRSSKAILGGSVRRLIALIQTVHSRYGLKGSEQNSKMNDHSQS